MTAALSHGVHEMLKGLYVALPIAAAVTGLAVLAVAGAARRDRDGR